MGAKRLFDLMVSLLGMMILSPLLFIIASLILLDSGRPVLFKQKRMGKDWKEFTIYKFRTMYSNSADAGAECSFKDDKRMTRPGKYLRRYRLDEIPQLFNVLKGDMSLVGPRPELPKFVFHYPEAYDKILKIRPGITDLASIEFRNESSLMNGDSIEVEKFYVCNILPKKIVYNIDYVKHQSFFHDLYIVLKTLHMMVSK